MNKQYALLLLVLVGVAGCSRKKNKGTKRYSKNKTEVFSEVDFPTADEVSNKLRLDDDVNEFKIIDDLDGQVAALDQAEDFKWMDDASQEDAFKVVYFDFDKYTVRKDQERVLNHDITLAKRVMDEAQVFGDQGSQLPQIIIEGHACHSAGSRAYNLALSEKRAKVIADRLIAAGIPRNCIKIVGRGAEVPALINGMPVEGGRESQAPNRRDEFRILYA